MCTRHYQKWLRHKRFGTQRPNRDNGATLQRDAKGNKQCIACLLWLGEDNFTPHGKTLDRLQVRCKACVNNGTRLVTYKATVADVARWMTEQNNQCAVCKSSIAGKYAIDHDHACCPSKKSCGKCVRGLLCHKCNLGLGAFRDNIEVLTSAINYLKKEHAHA